jgi:vancomycin resistance protein VanW
VRISQHSSLLRRQLGADEVDLQENKVVNLRLASAHVDGLLIRPGETFSVNRTVGNCTARKGYVSGMRLRNGETISGVVGGLCQLTSSPRCPRRSRRAGRSGRGQISWSCGRYAGGL